VPTAETEAATAFETPPEDATDHQVAEGIRDGKYASPTKYGDFWLFALRVTGTGMAFRDSIDEWAFRDKALWLTDEFLERAASVPVIWGHPDRSGLNSEEYKKRSIGNAVLSYVDGDEVWCIAKIFNADAAELMQTSHRSTSPGVTPPKGSTPLLLEHGTDTSSLGTDAQPTKVLDEGLPLILDHLAVCELGVWDKEGPPEGIRLDATSRKDDSVTEEEKKALEKERDDARKDAAEAKEKLDAFEKAEKDRKDAAEDKERADKARKDAEEAEKEKLDSAKRDSRKDRHSKHDGDIMDCARCDSEETEEKEREDKAKKDAAAAQFDIDANREEQIKDSQTRIAMLERELAAIRKGQEPPTIEDANVIAAAFHRADSVYQMLGDRTPQQMPGERPLAYRRRLADGLRKYTKQFKTEPIHDSVAGIAFDLIENAIYDEALDEAKHPTIQDSVGILRERVTIANGKTRRDFSGNGKVAFEPFMAPSMKFKIRRPESRGN
jgi:hypothetical protein